MNKQELIDKAVEDLGGSLKSLPLYGIDGYTLLRDTNPYTLAHVDSYAAEKALYFCTTEEFTQRARELGWCNGYKYGVEYETHGKKPDLPDDIVIEVNGRRGKIAWTIKDTSWRVNDVFRIVDERYKPVATEPEKSWHEKGELPPVGEVCLFRKGTTLDYVWMQGEIMYISKFLTVVRESTDGMDISLNTSKELFRPLKTERERFVEAAWLIAENEINFGSIFRKMYDAGFKAPE